MPRTPENLFDLPVYLEETKQKLNTILKDLVNIEKSDNSPKSKISTLSSIRKRLEELATSTSTRLAENKTHLAQIRCDVFSLNLKIEDLFNSINQSQQDSIKRTETRRSARYPIYVEISDKLLLLPSFINYTVLNFIIGERDPDKLSDREKSQLQRVQNLIWNYGRHILPEGFRLINSDQTCNLEGFATLRNLIEKADSRIPSTQVIENNIDTEP